MNKGTLLTLLALTVLATGCTSNLTQESYGNNTVIEYSNDISQERVKAIHSGLVESGWDLNKANVTKQNETWYTVNLQTDIEEARITPSQQYRFQQTATLVEYNAFQRNETLQLRSYNTEGRLISVFTQ